MRTVRSTMAALAGVAMIVLLGAPSDVGAGSGPPPESIDIGSSPITGQSGNVLVATIHPPGGGEALGRICHPLDDPIDSLPEMNFSEVPVDEDPCGDPTPDALLPPGEYSVEAGVFEPGSMTPIRSLSARVTGVGTPLIDGSALSAHVLGDTDCDGDVDAVDALNDLRRVAALEPFAECVDVAGNVKCDDELAATDALFILRFVAALGNNYPEGCGPLLAAPNVLSPEDGTVFTNFPRRFDVDWEGVPGADSYVVQVDCQGCCTGGGFCTDGGRAYRTTTGIEDTTFEASIGGDNLGRFRVWALDANGRPGIASEWRTFQFNT